MNKCCLLSGDHQKSKRAAKTTQQELLDDLKTTGPSDTEKTVGNTLCHHGAKNNGGGDGDDFLGLLFCKGRTSSMDR